MENLTDFFMALWQPDRDELGIVLRGHIHVEHGLKRFLETKLSRPDELGRLDYSVRIRLALACGLRADLKGPLNALGALRNKFSHGLTTTLADKEVNQFYSTFGPAERKKVDFLFEEALERGRSIGQKPITLRELRPKERLTTFVAGLWFSVEEAAALSKQHGSADQGVSPQSN